MKVIIPLAGLGTRLRPHTHTKPKPLVNVAGKPVLGHILDKLQSLEAEEFVFITGYLGEQIEEYVRSHYHFVAHFVEQKERKGQAHAIYLAKELVDGPILIIFVDTIFDADLRQLNNIASDGIIYVKEVEDPRRFGVALLKDGYVWQLVEKPAEPVSHLAVIGVYYIKDSALLLRCVEELMREGKAIGGEYFLADALQLMIDRGTKFNAWTVEVWEDCGTAEALLHTNRYLLTLNGPHPAAGENCIILQPTYIARAATVRNSIIGPYVSIAEGAVIENAVIRDSIINEGAQINDAMLTHSLIGSGAKVRGIYKRLNVGDSSAVNFD